MNDIFKSNDGKTLPDKYQTFLRKQLTKQQKLQVKQKEYDERTYQKDSSSSVSKGTSSSLDLQKTFMNTILE